MNFSSLLAKFGHTQIAAEQGAEEFLKFYDATKSLCFAYCVHRAGSLITAEKLCERVYAAALTKQLSFLWFGTLDFSLLLRLVEENMKDITVEQADPEAFFVSKLAFLTEEEKSAASHFHESLWTLPTPVQQVIILAYLCGQSEEQLASTLGVSVQVATAHREEATKLLLASWQHSVTLEQKLDSLTVLPSLSLKNDEEIRSLLLMQWTQLKLRRTQWIVVGSLCAIFSNVVVAGVLAFVVVTQPTTSIRGASLQVASFDAIIVQRELKRMEADKALTESLKVSRGLAAYDAAQKLTELGLSSAKDSLLERQKENAQVEKMVKLLQVSALSMRENISIAQK